jgi:hypothetical protein
MADKWNPSVFNKNINCVAVGRLSAEMVNFLVQKRPSLSGILNPETDILFWKDRIKHTEKHRDDFMSDSEYLNCLESIPSIIESPDYISLHPKDSSISFIKDFSDHVAVAVRISVSGALSYRSMYPLTDAQLADYLRRDRAWAWGKTKS